MAVFVAWVGLMLLGGWRPAKRAGGWVGRAMGLFWIVLGLIDCTNPEYWLPRG